MVDEQRDHRALGMLQLAERRLLVKFPFHARYLARWVKQPSTETQTMAVTIRGGCVNLLFCAAAVVEWTLDELAAVLVHEVNHVLFGHLFMDPAEFTDAKALVAAQEITVNEWVLDKLPGCPILLEHFPDLLPNESTRDRYDQLATGDAKKRKNSGGGGADGDGGGGDPDGDADSDADADGDGDGNGNGRGNEGDGIGVGTGDGSDAQTASGDRQPGPIDDHRLWPEARADAAARTAIAATAIETRAALTGEEWARVSDEVKAAIERTMQLAVGHGHLPADIAIDVGDGKAGVDWRKELRRFVGQSRMREATFAWPSRRQPHLVGIVPGWRERAGRPNLMAVIDTSGSVTDALVADISAELNAMRSIVEVTVVECDAVVHRTYALEGAIKSVVGRGGTDLRPPFEPAVLRRNKPDVIVYFTDGIGPAPERAPPRPVLWCLVPGGQRPVAWGRVVQMLGIPWWMQPGVRWGRGGGGGGG